MNGLSLLEAFDDTVAKIAQSVARDFPGTSSDDLSQQLYLTILENRSRFKNPDNDGVTGALWKIAKGYATLLRSEALHISPQYAYRPSDIKRILEHTFNRGEWFDTHVPEDAESIKDSADELDLQSDIKWGWSQLHIDEQRIVFRRFALKDELDGTERKRLSRAMENLTEIVNTYPRPGHPRRAMTNARAGHVIGGSYE